MTTAVNKIWLATGAFAVAAATVLAPVVAQADPTDPANPADPIASSVGDAAGAPVGQRRSQGRAAAHPGRATAPGAGAAGATRAATPRAGATGPHPLFQNSLWWFGTPNPAPPPASYTRTFEPLAGLPGFSQPFFGWYRNLNFEACILGLGNTTVTSVGPYGTSTSSVSTNGC